MRDHDIHSPIEMDQKIQRLTKRARFFAVSYRVLLITGLFLLIAAVVLLFVTDLFLVWILLLPIALIALGIFLARVEYRLDLRLYDLHAQEPTEDSH